MIGHIFYNKQPLRWKLTTTTTTTNEKKRGNLNVHRVSPAAQRAKNCRREIIIVS